MTCFFIRLFLKQNRIEEALRLRLVEGLLQPGDQLSRRDALQQEFQVSRDTIQRVFDRLVADGFIVANGRGGTRVVERPPHLSRFALVFVEPVARWSRFWHALHREARALSQTGARDIVCFPDVAPHLDNPAFQQLAYDVRALRLAGIILASHPCDLTGNPILAQPRIPCVSIMVGPPLPGLPALYPDQRSFVDRSLDWLAARGHRRIGVLTTPGFPHDHVRTALAKRGLDTDPRWLQAVPSDAAEWARPCVHLMVGGAVGERPDALLITDDNLVEQAMAGVVAAGLRVPDDLTVVGHCNFPWPTPSVFPIRRIGYDTREILTGCLALIDAQRAQRHHRMETLIPARFEDEVAP
ncbi:MAG TPA: substrate-binding domain-containing protein [Planctomycetota bacterium]|nr:substrate-binding domain-containing protein [Planctomycetota bacterium]